MANNASVPVLISRPRAAGRTFWQAQSDWVTSRATPVFSQLIDIVGLDVDLRMQESEIAIFTSSNGVRHAPPGDGRAAFCVGQRTTETAADHGWSATCAGADAQALIARLAPMRPLARFVHLGGVHHRGDIVKHLTDAGHKARHVALYEQRPCAPTAEARRVLETAPQVIAPVFSPKTACELTRYLSRPSAISVLAISAATAGEFRDLPLARLRIATTPDAHAMSVLLAQTLAEISDR